MEIRISCWREAKTIFLCILLCFLIVPIIVLIITILRVKKEIWVFDTEQSKLIHRYGLISKNEEAYYLKDITDSQMNMTVNGRIWKYGNIRFTIIGQRSKTILCAKHPEDVQATFVEMIQKFAKKDVTEVLTSRS